MLYSIGINNIDSTQRFDDSHLFPMAVHRKPDIRRLSMIHVGTLGSKSESGSTFQAGCTKTTGGNVAIICIHFPYSPWQDSRFLGPCSTKNTSHAYHPIFFSLYHIISALQPTSKPNFLQNHQFCRSFFDFLLICEISRASQANLARCTAAIMASRSILLQVTNEVVINW